MPYPIAMVSSSFFFFFVCCCWLCITQFEPLVFPILSVFKLQCNICRSIINSILNLAALPSPHISIVSISVCWHSLMMLFLYRLACVRACFSWIACLPACLAHCVWESGTNKPSQMRKVKLKIRLVESCVRVYVMFYFGFSRIIRTKTYIWIMFGKW